MRMKLKQINKQYVKKIHIPDEDKRPIKGFDICEEVYANIFLCAKKKSGKTNALCKIMEECASRNTIIYIFSSTAYKDKNWIQIRKRFLKKGMELHVFTSLFDGGVDQLDKLVKELQKHAKEAEEAEEDQDSEGDHEQMDPCDQLLMRLGALKPSQQEDSESEQDSEDSLPKKRRDRYLAPEYMIVLDDLSDELKSRSLLRLLKFNRHFKSKVIISSQWPHDLLPESRKQIDLFLIFKGFTASKLQETIYKDCDSSVPFDDFFKMYEAATLKPFSFLYVDSRADKFRRNLDCLFILPNHEN